MNKREGSLLFLILSTFSFFFVTGFTLPTIITMASSGSTFKTTTTSTKALAADLADGADSLYAMTPLILSSPLSKLVGEKVYLKLDLLQPSGSFKDRGMAHLCATFEKEGVTELISSSGGNAGLAVATVGHQLNMSVSVIVPQTTKPLVIDKLESLGAQ